MTTDAAPPPSQSKATTDGVWRTTATIPIASAIAGLASGAAAFLLGRTDLAEIAWTIGVVPVLATLVWQIVSNLRRGDVGLDLIAALAMAAALSVGETLAAAVVALMYAGGQALEAFAQGRASREMSALLDRAPRTAARYEGSTLSDVPIALVVADDRLMVRLGDVVPVDGVIAGSPAVLDEAALTGESLPVTKRDGEAVMSGSTNVGAAFDLVARETASRSTYSGVIRLVEEAMTSQAPMTRLADRYALGFMLATLALSAFAWWISGDPVRAVAVLVVATPCPLILAVPVAIVAGMSRAAKAGVLVKGGAALETLARIHTLVIDKTGTLTRGEATLAEVIPANDWSSDEALRLAASLDQASQHVVARALVRGASDRAIVLELPVDVQETVIRRGILTP